MTQSAFSETGKPTEAQPVSAFRTNSNFPGQVKAAMLYYPQYDFGQKLAARQFQHFKGWVRQFHMGVVR